MTCWPADPEALARLQGALARERPPEWSWPGPSARSAGCAVVFARHAASPGAAGDVGRAAAVVVARGAVVAWVVRVAPAAAPFAVGFLAMREGPLLEEAVRALSEAPDVLLVRAAGRDHPRRAGLALHLGWALDLPTVGVTDRPLLARGAPPGPRAGAASPLELDGERVGYLVRTRERVLPVAAHAAWRTSAETAAEVVRALATRARTPEPLREALRRAREARG